MLHRKFSLIIVSALLLIGVSQVGFAAKDAAMSVEGNGNTITNGDNSPSTSDHTDFATVDVGNTFDRTFTIRNSSAGQLQLNGSPTVAIQGGQAADFTVTAQPGATTLANNATTTFTVRFAPSAAGIRSTTISIDNNDPDDNPYTFDIRGNGNLSVTVPSVTNTSFTSITSDSASLRANVTSDGGAAVTERGFAWNTSGLPTISDTTVSSAGATPIDFTLTASSLPPATQIYARGYAINSVNPGYASSDMIFWTEPGSPATNVTFPVTGADSMTVQWSRGGGAGVIVLIKKDAPVDSPPVDGVDTYTASGDYSSPGTEIGSGNYVLYIGTGTSVDVTNLIPGGVYNIAVYEYAGSGSGLSGINYLQTAPPTNSQLIVGPPSASTVSSSNVLQTTADVQITIASDGGGTITQHGTMWSSSPLPAPPAFTGNETFLGTYSGGVPGSFSDSFSGLPASSIVYLRGYVTNGDGTDHSDDGTFYTEPSTQATNVTFSGETESSMQINWVRGNGSGSIVIVKADSTPDATPVDGTVYTASTIFGTGAAEIGTSNYVAYKGTGTSVTLTNLAGGTTYYVVVYEYMGSGSGSSGINYRLSNAPTGNKKIIGYPNISTPVVLTSPATTSVTLEASINNDGGDPVTERGFVWNTTGSPILTDSKVTQSGSWSISSPTTYSLSTGSGLTPATKYYFSGYATNPFGTSFTSDGTFYTEPSTQASAIAPWDVTFELITITWTPGDGDGAIVIVREGSAVDADPVDGTVYNADPNFMGPANEIGTGNRIIYVGDQARATVTTLSLTTTYHFAVYEYKGSGSGNSGINYKLTPIRANFTTEEAPIGHNYEHNIGCTYCHNTHVGLVPRDAAQEATCIAACHYPGSPKSIYQDVAVHTGGHADCGSCHQIHSGIRAETDLLAVDTHVGGITAMNDKWVRANTTFWQPNALEDAIFHPAADPNIYLAFGTYTPMPPPERQVAPRNGLCQTCHTTTNYHTNDNLGDYTHPDAAQNPDNLGCLDCHPHSAGFAPQISADKACLDVVGCHGGNDAGSLRNILAELDSGSHHLSGTSSSVWGSVDRLIDEADCKVCHMEPDTGHMNGVIDLRDPDTGLALTGFASLSRDTGVDTLEADVLYVQNNFCLKCHDSGGASSTLSQNPTGGSASQPFANAGPVPNIFDAFNPTYPSHHAVRGPGNNPFCNSTTMAAPWNQTDDHDEISCFDCHMTDTQGAGIINVHGSSNNHMLVSQITGTTDAAGIESFCTRCHAYESYVSSGTGTPFVDHSKGQHNANAYSCRGCHAGQVDDDKDSGNDNGAAYPQIMIHGSDWTWPSTARTPNIPQDSFMFGGWLGGLDVNTPTCYGGNCSHTSSPKTW